MKALSSRFLRLSTQRALLCQVWPELRAVYVDGVGIEDDFNVGFYHHGQINELGEELVQDIFTDILADCGFRYGRWCKSSCVSVRVDFPQRPPQIGRCIYFRHEPISYSKTLGHEHLKKCLESDSAGKYIQADLDMIIGFALQGHVTPNLRRAAFEIAESKLNLYFYFDGPIQNEEQALIEKIVSEVAIEIALWPPSKDLEPVPVLIRLDYPEWLPQAYNSVYVRYESNPDKYSGSSQYGIIPS